ncbi:hypothetical protein PRZ48_000341 [Zasmidium cellare]|uniref:Uncharacterized protein n=1 Tax=Zasmidium cellare TaxID=395010 RepID=A0ABR0EZ12_ZASCE|nr:hypothetical protein PRZ48_000341 [Zasmidium cellare]
MSATPNQDAFYAAQHEEINGLFTDVNASEEELIHMLDQPLADPFVPRWYRTKYHIIRAWYGEPEENLRDAKDGMEEMREVYRVEEKTEEWISERMLSLQEMIDLVESCLVDDNEPSGAEPNDTSSAVAGASAAVSSTEEAPTAPPVAPSGGGVEHKRTREVTPVPLYPTPLDTGHRVRKQPSRRVNSNQSTQSDQSGN